jgi:DNA-binding XRE family transcriptional regulator
MNQAELAEEIQVSTRTIASYEVLGMRPRGDVAARLARALNLSLSYLLDDTIPFVPSNPGGLDPNVSKHISARSSVATLLSRNCAFLLSSQVTQSEKDAFFDDVMHAYITNKKKTNEVELSEQAK